MSDPLPLACELSDAEFRARRDGLFAEVQGAAASARRVPGGVELEFPAKPATLQSVLDLVAAESRCCRFLQFTLRIGPASTSTILTITGPDGTQAFLEAMGLAPSAPISRDGPLSG